MTLTNEQKIANENYFLQMLEARTKLFLWKNQGECFDFSSGQIVPFTKKGYDAMEYHTRHGFCRQFLLPSKDNLTPMKTEFRFAETILTLFPAPLDALIIPTRTPVSNAMTSMSSLATKILNATLLSIPLLELE